jgi:uncharacterized protein
MAISLYDATVAGFQQTLAGVAGFLDRGLAHCHENNIDPATLVETRLYGDMLPLRFQVQQVAHHSIGAIEAVKAGMFLPPMNIPPEDYVALQKRVADARESLGKLTAAEVNDLEGRDVVFQISDMNMLFTAQGFLLSLSLPMFFFAATTAYDILRSQGVPLGKRDFMGPLRLKS